MPVQFYSSQEQALAASGTAGDRRVLPYASQGGPKQWVIVEAPPIVDGHELRDARAARASVGSTYDIVFSLKNNAANKFGTWTASNINSYLGVVLNDEVKSIAYIRSQIYDQGEISGQFTKQSAEDLALVLRAGALPAPVKFVDERIDP
jgi:preprotein translocase subunit SecD